MAGTPLRSYIREIEKHIESGRNDEAIAHCRYILETYPMYTDTYRLLGKAFLESQRYGDAADIFQRVLSSIPDDFVAHVGMSIIREDEGNLDESIWHMERAFEIQPANSAIQDELRRLFGRRDGAEPPKIRLTRGALARMYYKGGLYQQAIAETRTALAENPNRLDLQVLLAEIYEKTGQKAEATDTANSILKKIPYCLIANQIMAASLSGTEHDQEGQIFRQRLNKLDPYTVHIGPNNSNAASVPDQAITLQKLDWRPGQMIGKSEGQPAWASSLGVELGELSPTKEEPLPEWLSGPSQGTPAERVEEGLPTSPSAFSLESLGEIPAPGQPVESVVPSETPVFEEDLPEWIKGIDEEMSPSEVSGIDKSLGAAVTQDQTSIKPDGGEIAAAEIPDWLRAMAPIPGLEGAPESETEPSPWIDVISTPEETKIPSGKSEAKEESPARQEGVEVPDWIKSVEPPVEASSGAEALDQLPDWLTQESKSPIEEANAQEVEKIEGLEITPEGELPAWLFEGEEHPIEPLTAEELEISAEVQPGTVLQEAFPTEAEPAEVGGTIPAEEVPEWLREVASLPLQPPSEINEPISAYEEIPDWLLESEHPSAIEDKPILADETTLEAEAISPISSEEESVWLVEEEVPPESTLQEETIVEPGVEEIPDWLKEISVASAVDIPEWLLEEETPPTDQLPIEAGIPEQIETETISPEEIQEFEEIHEIEEEPVEISDTQPTKVVTPEQTIVSTAEPIEPLVEQVFLEEAAPLERLEEAFAHPEEVPGQKELEGAIPVSEPATPIAEVEPAAALNEEEAAFAWLEGLAVKQGADEALLLKPEERLDTPPEWIQRTMEAEASAKPESEIPPTIEEEAIVIEEIPTEVAIEAEVVTEFQAPGIEATEEALGVTVVSEEITPPAEEEPLPLEVPTMQLETVPEAEVEAIVISEIGEGIPEAPEVLVEAEPETIEIVEAEYPPPIQKIDLNQASLAELERLPGVGFIAAQRIVDFREIHGPFSDLDDLSLIPDFNPATLEGVRDYLYVETIEEIPAFPVEELISMAEEGESAIELEKAQQPLVEGDLEQALKEYAKLIQSGQEIPRIIQDLEQISRQYPQEIRVWQELGDAYFRSDQLTQALKAYVEAERLL